jgi:hypothetical protein
MREEVKKIRKKFRDLRTQKKNKADFAKNAFFGCKTRLPNSQIFKCCFNVTPF